MENQNFKKLVSKYLQNKATAQERMRIEQWFNSELSNSKYLPGHDAIETADKRIYAKLAQHINKPAPRVILFKYRYSIAAAASILVILSFAFWFFGRRQSAEQMATTVLPGGNRAVLTLANGQKIVLTTAKNGIIAQQGAIAINKTADGKVVYNGADATAAKVVADNNLAYNTISTPCGGQYWVVLADGTRVLLNAASSLKYPVAFNGNERLVELTGEAYFEVVHNAQKPFRVKTASQVVEDVGTHFNINAYTDEPDTKTTLLEGGIKITRPATAETKILVPGQQAVLNSQVFTIRKVDVAESVAWKDGLFVFDHTDLHALMRQVSRWYNIKVVYQGNVTNDEFFGEVQRKYTLAEVVKVLKLGGLNFRIEEPASPGGQKQFIITP